jgi:glycerophosphoryl diester phosphodiesterase
MDNNDDKNSIKKYEIRDELDERPSMGPVVEEVHVIIPDKPDELREKTLEFLEGIELAYGVRVRDGELKIETKKDEVFIYRELEKKKREIRYYRKGKERAIIFCDSREYENLRKLGLVRDSKDK